jgi:hypothetical protein
LIFPAPLGPSIPNISPLFILKFILSKINLFPYEREISSNSISEADIFERFYS